MPLPIKKVAKFITAEKIVGLCYDYFPDLMSEFYEMQSSFLTNGYAAHRNLDISIIELCFLEKIHLSIIRQREKYLDKSLSLETFFDNCGEIECGETNKHKIVNIVKKTGIPKETVRRKLKILIDREIIITNKFKDYCWNCNSNRNKQVSDAMERDVKATSRFICAITKFLDFKLLQTDIEKEIKNHFSFYFYHFSYCQLQWFKMWQSKIKDIDLIFIAIQILIPTLKYYDNNSNLKKLGLEKIYTVIGKTAPSYSLSNTTVSASSISEITGIPRATCIRKLEKLMKLGMLKKELKSKKYYVNQSTVGRGSLITKETINATISNFSYYLSIVINSLSKNIYNFKN